MQPQVKAPRRGWAALLAGLWALGGLLAAVPAPAATDQPAGCALLWRVQVQLDTVPRQLRVVLAFDAGGRNQSTLRLPGGWAGLEEIDTPRLQAVPNAPLLRTVRHVPGERVQLAWRLSAPGNGPGNAPGYLPSNAPSQVPPDGPAGSGALLAATWFAFSGAALLPMPDDTDERTSPASACIALSGLPAGSRFVSSQGAAEGSEVLFRVAGGAAPLAVRVQQGLYAGGDLWVHTAATTAATTSATTAVADSPLTVALPQAAPWRFSVDALAQASGRALAAQRRYWGDTAPGGPGLVLLLPDPGAGEGTGGTAWHQALALQASADLAIPSAAFDGLITQALARAWVAERFGPLAHAGRGDEGLRAWYSEGWADFLAHRALLREGQWTPEDYAAALNRKIERTLDAIDRAGPDRPVPSTAAAATTATAAATATATTLPAARGEWLALRWHAALRAAGRPGLEALLQRLQVPAAQARREGPISAPLATHRVLAALRPVLGDAALGDLNRMTDQADFFRFEPTALGPCFTGRRQPVGRWRLGFDAASLGRGRVSGVEPGGPADAAGLRDGMILHGHALVPGDATQPVRLQLQGDGGGLSELSYLPAGEPVRQLPRYRPVPQAMQQPACLGWLGLGPEAARAAASGQPSPAKELGPQPGSPAGAKAKAKAGSKGQPKPKTGAAGSGKASGNATSSSTSTGSSTGTGTGTGTGAATSTAKATSKAGKTGKPATTRPKP